MPITQQLLFNLYVTKHLSAKEVSLLLNCSEHKVRYWLEKYHIPIRTRSQANYHKYNPHGDPFKFKRHLNEKDTRLFYLCLGLYWGEGNKLNTSAIRLTNTDGAMLYQWILFLRNICGVYDHKIHYYVQVFQDNNTETVKHYWSKTLHINPNKILSGKPTKKQGNGTYLKVNKHGVMTIVVSNIKLRNWLIDKLQQLGYKSPK